MSYIDCLPERMLTKIEVAPSGCWEWIGYRDKIGGYGIVRFDGKVRKAHRVTYGLLVGPISDGLTIDHLCRVRHCVNPDHMEPVTQAENNKRGLPHRVLPTHCPQGHPYDEENTIVMPRQRACKTCRRGWVRSHRARQRASGVQPKSQAKSPRFTCEVCGAPTVYKYTCGGACAEARRSGRYRNDPEFRAVHDVRAARVTLRKNPASQWAQRILREAGDLT